MRLGGTVRSTAVTAGTVAATAPRGAARLYPGPVGELLSRELLTWEEFGYRLGGSQLVMRLVDHVLKAPLAQGEVA